jgi:hypothetical protein
MSGYDDWKTTPPDERGYCPRCYASWEDMLAADDEFACSCGWSGDRGDLLSHREMVREGCEDARLDRAGL